MLTVGTGWRGGGGIGTRGSEAEWENTLTVLREFVAGVEEQIKFKITRTSWLCEGDGSEAFAALPSQASD